MVAFPNAASAGAHHQPIHDTVSLRSPVHPQAIPAPKVAAIQQRYRNGEPINSISRNEKVSRSTVSKYVRDLPRREPGRVTRQLVEEIKTLRAQGHKQLFVARKLGVSMYNVKKHEQPDGAATPRPKGRPRKTAADAAR
jgi:hypothetical protein